MLEIAGGIIIAVIVLVVVANVLTAIGERQPRYRPEPPPAPRIEPYQTLAEWQRANAR